MDLKSLSNEELIALKKRLEVEVIKHDVTERGIKVCLNALYGAQGNPFFIFYNLWNAEAITLSGQAAIQAVSKKASDRINKLAGTNSDNVIYTDTDSLFLDLGPVVPLFKFKTDDKMKNSIKITEFVDTVIGPLVYKICDDYGKQLNMFEIGLEFKREKIISDVIFVSKKRYACLVIDSEGVRNAEPELYVTGLESKRSSTPKFVRSELEKIYKLGLTQGEEAIQKELLEFEETFKQLGVKVISKPSSVNDIDKWVSNDEIGYKKGVPIHVRAAITFNKMVKKLGLEKRYRLIKNGDKIRWIFLKPNPTRENVIAVTDGNLPKEFGLDNYVDYRTMFEKTVFSPVESFCSAAGWSPHKVYTLDSIFG